MFVNLRITYRCIVRAWDDDCPHETAEFFGGLDISRPIIVKQHYQPTINNYKSSIKKKQV